MPHTVLIADDSAVLRRALVEHLRSLDGVEVVAEARDGAEAVERAEALRPEIVLLDLQMPRMSGLEALRAIRQRLPDTRVVILTNHADAVYRRTCLAAGADHFLDKSSAFESLGAVLNQVVAA